MFQLTQDMPSPDRMLSDIVANVKGDGICKHFAELFVQGSGGVVFEGKSFKP